MADVETGATLSAVAEAGGGAMSDTVQQQQNTIPPLSLGGRGGVGGDFSDTVGKHHSGMPASVVAAVGGTHGAGRLPPPPYLGGATSKWPIPEEAEAEA